MASSKGSNCGTRDISFILCTEPPYPSIQESVEKAVRRLLAARTHLSSACAAGLRVYSKRVFVSWAKTDMHDQCCHYNPATATNRMRNLLQISVHTGVVHADLSCSSTELHYRIQAVSVALWGQRWPLPSRGPLWTSPLALNRKEE